MLLEGGGVGGRRGGGGGRRGGEERLAAKNLVRGEKGTWKIRLVAWKRKDTSRTRTFFLGWEFQSG